MGVRLPPDHPSIATRGWCDTRERTVLRLVWSGTGFSLRVRGGSVLVDLAGAGMVDFRLDGRIAHAAGPGLGPVRIALPADGLDHELVVEKITEPVAGVAVFRGLELEGGATASPPLSGSGPRLLFLGDSLTCGYGVLAEDRSEGFSARTESVRLSFAGIAGDALGASCQFSAWSGKGLAENFDRTRTEVLPGLWRLADPFDPSSTLPDPPRPDLVLVNLGSNDVFHADPDWDAFARAAVALGEDLRGVFPRIPIVLLDGPAITDLALRDADGNPRPLLTRVRAALDAAARELAPGGATFRFALPSCVPDEPHGADSHPGRERQRLAGLALADFLEHLPLLGRPARA